ncbi:hypothetical protein J6590_037760 [Homalodisca vitripennis]|nr:hypothetical protein J6590_037760 [Homalodisca vitripennis]
MMIERALYRGNRLRYAVCEYGRPVSGPRLRLDCLSARHVTCVRPSTGSGASIDPRLPCPTAPRRDLSLPSDFHSPGVRIFASACTCDT